MKYRTAINQILSLFIIASFTSCYELQSDEELREDIIGTWKKVDCKYPYGDDKDVTFESPLKDRMTFYPNGELLEEGYYAYCCTTECDTAFGGPCVWVVENGSLVILPDQSTYFFQQLNQPFPIKHLKGELLVFDNVFLNEATRRKVCYCRQ